MKIAIIDDIINEQFLQYPNRLLKKMDCTGAVINELSQQEMNHGTLCARILESCLPWLEYKLYNINIMGTDKGLSGIEKLELALKCCLELNVNIVNLSVGSIRISDFVVIKNVIATLSKRCVIVASYSNTGYITIPASLSEVIGVLACSSDLYYDSNFFYTDTNSYGIDILAKYKDNKILNINECRGNSLVVPIVVAKCSKIIFRDQILYNTFEMKKILKKEIPHLRSDFMNYAKEYDANIPNIYISDSLSISIKDILEILTNLRKTNNFEGIVLSAQKESDIRNVNNINILRYTYVDYRIVFGKKDEFKLNYNLCIDMNKESVVVENNVKNSVYKQEDICNNKLEQIISEFLNELY